MTVQVSATDDDAGSIIGEIMYSLLGSGAGTLFVMDSQTGEISLTASLNRELIAQYNLVATATDENGAGLSSYIDMLVNVFDINDIRPSCPELVYEGSVSENQPAGNLIHNVIQVYVVSSKF